MHNKQCVPNNAAARCITHIQAAFTWHCFHGKNRYLRTVYDFRLHVNDENTYWKWRPLNPETKNGVKRKRWVNSKNGEHGVTVAIVWPLSRHAQVIVVFKNESQQSACSCEIFGSVRARCTSLNTRGQSYCGSNIWILLARRRPWHYWVKPKRTCSWWDNFLTDVVSPKKWRENFRMSCSNFFLLCQKLRPLIERQATIMRQSVLKCRLCNSILPIWWRSPKKDNQCFWTGSLHCANCYLSSLLAIILAHNTLNNQRLYLRLIRRLETSNFPKCLCAVDGTHININSPAAMLRTTMYINRKSRFLLMCKHAVTTVVDSWTW